MRDFAIIGTVLLAIAAWVLLAGWLFGLGLRLAGVCS